MENDDPTSGRRHRMRRSPFLLPILGLFALNLACAQESSPGQEEVALLMSLAGEYTYDYTEVGAPPGSGEISFESFAGGQFLKFEETWIPGEGDPMGIQGFIGYDVLGGYFTWYRVFDNGAYDHARGSLEDGGITFEITESRTEAFGENDWAGPGIELRTRWTDFTEDGWRFIWERSVDGGPWELLSGAQNKRVR
jgi:hypothetical protein